MVKIMETHDWPRYFFGRDDCEVCNGDRGGIRGSENIVNGVVMCDYCSTDNFNRINTVDNNISR